MEENDRDRAKHIKANRSSSCCLPNLFCWKNYDETSDEYTQEPSATKISDNSVTNVSLITREEWKREHCFQIKPDTTTRYLKSNLFSLDFELLKKELELSLSTEKNVENPIFEDFTEINDLPKKIKNEEEVPKKLSWPLFLQEYNGRFSDQYFRRQAQSKKTLAPLALCVESVYQILEWNILKKCLSGTNHPLKDKELLISNADDDVHFLRIFDKIPKGNETRIMEKIRNSYALVPYVGNTRSPMLEAWSSPLPRINVEIQIEEYLRNMCFSLYSDELSKLSFNSLGNLLHADNKQNQLDTLVIFEEYDHFKVIGIIVYPEEILDYRNKDKNASLNDFASDQILYIPLVILFQSWKSTKIYINKQQFYINMLVLLQHVMPSKFVFSTFGTESSGTLTAEKKEVRKQKNKRQQNADQSFQLKKSTLKEPKNENTVARNAMYCIKEVNARYMTNRFLRTSYRVQTQMRYRSKNYQVIQSSTVSPSTPDMLGEAFKKPIEDHTDLSVTGIVPPINIEEVQSTAKDDSDHLTVVDHCVNQGNDLASVSNGSNVAKTTFGFGLDQVVIGDKSTDLSTIVAGDGEAFALFRDFYKKAVGDFHPDFNPAHLQSSRTASHLETLQRTSFPRINTWSVDHCTASVFRSLQTFPFASFATAKQKMEICNIMKGVAEHLNVRYISVETEDPEEKKVLMSNCKLLFPAKAKEQPNYCQGKAILIDQDDGKHLLVKVNFDEHLEIRCQVKHSNYKKAYLEVLAMEDQIQQYLITIGLEYCHDINFGYLNSSLKNIGIALLIQVEMIIPELLKHPLYSEIMEYYALRKRYQGRKRGKTFDVIKLERTFNFAATEIDAVSQFYETTTSLVEMERRLSRRGSIHELLPDNLKQQNHSNTRSDQRRDRSDRRVSCQRTRHGRKSHAHNNPKTEIQSNQPRFRRIGQYGGSDGDSRAGMRSDANNCRGNMH